MDEHQNASNASSETAFSLHARTLVDVKLLGPDDSIILGYNMCLAATAKDTSIQKSAYKGVAEYERIFDLFTPDTVAGFYVTRLRAIATALAQGIISRRKRRDEETETALNTFEDRRRERVFYATLSGMAKTSVRVLVLGGFVAATSAAVFSHPIMAEKTTTDPTLTAIAAALGSMLIGTASAMYTSWRNAGRFRNEYLAAHDTARRRFSISAREEYQRAAEQAEYMWRVHFPDVEPRMSYSVRNLIEGLAGTDMYEEDEDEILRTQTIRELFKTLKREAKLTMVATGWRTKEKIHTWIDERRVHPGFDKHQDDT